MRIKRILNELNGIGKIILVFSVLIFLSNESYAEYYLVYSPAVAMCVTGCGPHRHRVRHHYKHRCTVKKTHYRRHPVAVFYTPPCVYVPSCGGCCSGYAPAVYTTRYYGVYYHQPAYYRDYPDRGDDVYYGAYNNDMRTGDDVAVGMNIDY